MSANRSHRRRHSQRMRALDSDNQRHLSNARRKLGLSEEKEGYDWTKLFPSAFHLAKAVTGCWKRRLFSVYHSSIILSVCSCIVYQISTYLGNDGEQSESVWTNPTANVVSLTCICLFVHVSVSFYNSMRVPRMSDDQTKQRPHSCSEPAQIIIPQPNNKKLSSVAELVGPVEYDECLVWVFILLLKRERIKLGIIFGISYNYQLMSPSDSTYRTVLPWSSYIHQVRWSVTKKVRNYVLGPNDYMSNLFITGHICK